MIRVRPLGASEWPAFKDFRLMALESAPGMFATSYDEASARSPEAWQETIAGPNHQVFGLFDAAQLIGITGVFGGRDESSDDAAFLVMSFILPEYRRRGLSLMLLSGVSRLDTGAPQIQASRSGDTRLKRGLATSVSTPRFYLHRSQTANVARWYHRRRANLRIAAH